MPRTKVSSRNGANNKRIREANLDLEEFLRDFDVDVENSIQKMQSKLAKDLRSFDTALELIKKEIPLKVLQMTMKEASLLKVLNEADVDENRTNLNVTVKETVSKADEGYITEEKSLIASSSDGEMNNKSLVQNVSVLGSLKSLRRSKSALSLATPGPRAFSSAMKNRMTPLQQTTTSNQPAPHTSRSKYRTPMTGVRQKAISVDRMNTITPKVNPLKPFSMLRHARQGEPVFSLTGSPIMATSVCELTANVNIPYANGIISIRPQQIDPTNLDQSLIHKFDDKTIAHLRTLKQNLDILMTGFNRKFNH